MMELRDKLVSLPTPFYFYNIDFLNRTIDELERHRGNIRVYYSFKANCNPAVLEFIKGKGLGAEVVSEGELKLALTYGFENIVMSGVGKTDEQIKLAIVNQIDSINIESIEEIEVIDQFCQYLGKDSRICLRVNPNVDPLTHKAVTTGLYENKFGINFEDLEEALKKLKKSKRIEFIGLHFHIGSQITDMSVFKNLCIRVNEILDFVLARKMNIRMLNLGGGLAVDYYNPDSIPNFEEYFGIIKKFCNFSGLIVVEPGRSIVAQCGTLVSKVLFKKRLINKEIVILDSGMNHLIRPALYQAYHRIENLTKLDQKAIYIYDVHGPICESTDYFAKNVLLPFTERGDYLAIRSAGAYGEVMMSNYNLRGYPNFFYLRNSLLEGPIKF